ncbi:hypothetical protein T10_7055 [Trichinella papuae]|uniref:Uncharacterized protein n=1 Tax=Trichinella papuae TaxID=268474 RepID=A0A0V1N2E5_9BILA|nr:hypothetical protein T10_7055 [Trichinella papuae]
MPQRSDAVSSQAHTEDDVRAFSAIGRRYIILLRKLPTKCISIRMQCFDGGYNGNEFVSVSDAWREVPISMSSAVHMRRFMEYGYEIRARSKATLRMLFAGNFTIDEGIAWAQQLRLLFYSYKIPNARHNFI